MFVAVYLSVAMFDQVCDSAFLFTVLVSVAVSMSVTVAAFQCPFPYLGGVRLSAILSVYVSVFLLMSVAACVDQCPCSWPCQCS